MLHNFLHTEDAWDDDDDGAEDTEPVDQNQIAEDSWDEDEDEQRNLGVLRRELFLQEFVAREEQE